MTDGPRAEVANRDARRDRNIIRALGLLLSVVTALLGMGLFAHTRHLGADSTGTLGFTARLSEAAPRFGEALAVVLVWVCAVLAAASVTLALLGRPWRLSIHFGVAAGFAALAFSIAGVLAYAVSR